MEMPVTPSSRRGNMPASVNRWASTGLAGQPAAGIVVGKLDGSEGMDGSGAPNCGGRGSIVDAEASGCGSDEETPGPGRARKNSFAICVRVATSGRPIVAGSAGTFDPAALASACDACFGLGEYLPTS